MSTKGQELPGGPFVLLVEETDPGRVHGRSVIGPFATYEVAAKAAEEFADSVITYLYDVHDWFAYKDNQQ